jgi:hypothetical protein
VAQLAKEPKVAERSTEARKKPDLVGLAETLKDTVAYLDDYIEARASQLAARRIADAELVAAARIATIEEAWATDKQRYADLERELRRQLRALQQQVAPRPRSSVPAEEEPYSS